APDTRQRARHARGAARLARHHHERDRPAVRQELHPPSNWRTPMKSRVCAERIADEPARRSAVEILRATYQDEKRWVADPESQFPAADLERSDVTCFLVSEDDRPVGVLRLLYDPPLMLYAKYGFKPLEASLDVESFVRQNRIVEIGRFAVLPEYRSHMV